MVKLGILFGGKSGEHEISILSAASVAGAIDRTKYAPVFIGISRTGRWHLITDSIEGISGLDDGRVRTLTADCPERGLNPGDLPKLVDFAFPVLHGPYGEDGKIQGLFEMLDLPYAGCGVAASAVSMDKIFTREIWNRAGLPVCGYTTLREHEYLADPSRAASRVEEELGFPLFVKPANLGSSVGISKVKERAGLKGALDAAFLYDNRLIIEEGVDCRELEIAVTGNLAPELAAIGEIKPAAEFYDYESKYRDAGTELCIPADLPEETVSRIKGLAAEAYRALNGEGFARIDFFLEKTSGKIFLNEINTIPGFTKYSMFPLLWREAGVAYGELIERIIRLGYERYYAKNNRESNNAR